MFRCPAGMIGAWPGFAGPEERSLYLRERRSVTSESSARPLRERVSVVEDRDTEVRSDRGLALDVGRLPRHAVDGVTAYERCQLVRVPELEGSRPSEMPKQREMRRHRCDELFVDELVHDPDRMECALERIRRRVRRGDIHQRPIEIPAGTRGSFHPAYPPPPHLSGRDLGRFSDGSRFAAMKAWTSQAMADPRPRGVRSSRHGFYPDIV